MTTPYDESLITATFALIGLGEKIQPLRKPAAGDRTIRQP
jgi:hypothetical protein